MTVPSSETEEWTSGGNSQRMGWPVPIRCGSARPSILTLILTVSVRSAVTTLGGRKPGGIVNEPPSWFASGIDSRPCAQWSFANTVSVVAFQ